MNQSPCMSKMPKTSQVNESAMFAVVGPGKIIVAIYVPIFANRTACYAKLVAEAVVADLVKNSKKVTLERGNRPGRKDMKLTIEFVPWLPQS
jgi:hypothetical protein